MKTGFVSLSLAWAVGVFLSSQNVPALDVGGGGGSGVAEVSADAGLTAGLPGDGSNVAAGAALVGASSGPRVRAWGGNSSGQCNVPIDLTDPLAVAAGGYQSLALRVGGILSAWGTWSSIVPVGLGDLAAIAAGSSHSIGLRSNGTVLAWGENMQGQRNIPAGLAGVVAIATRNNHNLALRSNGWVVAWGQNGQGQCNVPTGLSNVVAIAAGGFHSLALRADGTVIAWGQTGVPGNLADVVAIAAGMVHSLALRADGSVVAWGGHGFGQPLVPNYGQCNVPAQLTNAVAVGSGEWHSLALLADGSVRAWGLNQNAQANVPGDLGFAMAVAGGNQHTLALVGDGSPHITLSPLSHTVPSGTTVSLHAKGAGAPPLSYQWQHNETDLAGATNASLTLTAARGRDTGRYRLVVQNAAGSATSGTAALNVVALPMVSAIPDHVVAVDVGTGPLPFTVSHEEVPADQLWVAATAEPSALAGSLLLAGSGTNRTIEVIPASGQFGVLTVTLTVSDALFTVTNRFLVTVAPVPIPIPPPAQRMVQGTASGPITFTITDPDTPLDQVTTAATAEPPGLFSSIQTGGSGGTRTIELVAAPDQYGAASVSLAVSDGTYTVVSNFLVTVLARPVLAVIPNQSVDQGASADPILLGITDPDTPWPEWRILVTSEHPLLVPPTNIQVVASEAGCFLQITPASQYSGRAPITVAVSDGTATAATSFTLQVRPRLQSPLLHLGPGQVLTQMPPQQLRFFFADQGTGSTNYTMEYLPDISGAHGWSNAPGVQITELGGGLYQADVLPPPEPQGFYRLKGFQPLVVNFSASGMQVDEGAGVAYLAVIFNGPFQGNVSYTVSGTAGANDFEALTGLVAVEGTTAAIPIVLRDDADIGSLRYLTLSLEADPAGAYQLGPTLAQTLTIEENDAVWQGQLFLDHSILASVTAAIVHTNDASGWVTNTTALPLEAQAVIDFVLTLRQTGASFQGALRSDQFGFFPTHDTPASITFTSERFSAAIDAIPLGADSTFLDVPAQLQLRLTAHAGEARHCVAPTQLEGDMALVMQWEGLPHLDTTNSGRFQLVRPPVAPGTNEVKLVSEH